jgi:small subunit ribosomal protein S17
MATTTPTTGEGTRGARVIAGIVTGDKTTTTRRVEVQRLVRHPQYGKFIKKRTVCYVHDENNESRLGDTVEIRESRPLSRTKRWTLVRVTVKAPTRTVANLEGAVAGSTLPEATGAGATA